MSEPPPSEDDLGFTRAPKKERPKRIEYYAEENFSGADLRRYVHIGWGVTIGAACIFACMGMSAVTQSRSWNVSFRWLQRRVGFQFGTLTYLITTMALYYHDGDKWCTRDWSELTQRFGSKAQSLPSTVHQPAAAAKAASQHQQSAMGLQQALRWGKAADRCTRR
eukprot:CAMPEP_0202868594 /NCGR_PEP_ID=MMETSP1391-20130828/10965_1 /ASSEMBLY_ACC=CAM_ASM_000867 /TAXON_ID=1034604 /ORGANISM="Chlamydomonas leiostraca, Strain SAG 11-49" /LENGTH=164 /DNA_ID=CAMNT_0049548779 /DNA_START=33 /DNA_END=525 /DNA_ORIENTATION=+